MKFRFDRYPDVVINHTINSRLRGFKYKDQRPTSVELTYKELSKLISTSVEVTLLELVSSMEHK